MDRYSVLADFAYNVTQKLATSADFFAYLSWHDRQPVITIDRLRGTEGGHSPRAAGSAPAVADAAAWENLREKQR